MTIKKTILIIEDNKLCLEMVKELLEINGFCIFEASHADEGIELAKQYKPDLILMDLNLPVKNGFEACKEIKSDSELKYIPIIAYTAMAMSHDQKKALECGCERVITKPIDINSFIATIESHIGVACHSHQSKK